MKTYAEIGAEIQHWSSWNFGLNRSWKGEHDGKTYLREIAPLMGMGEEIGEWCEAADAENYEGCEDAIGDILIYMLDFMWRDDVGFEILTVPLEDEHKGQNRIFVLYSKLLHATLKTHQGIRGYKDSNKYQEERNLILRQILHILNNLAEQDHNKSALEILNEVWERIVSKRDWTKDQNNAGTGE